MLEAQVVSLSICLFVQLFVVFHFHFSHGSEPTKHFFFHLALFLSSFARGCSVFLFLTPSFLISLPFFQSSLLLSPYLPPLVLLVLEKRRPRGSDEWKDTDGWIKPHENVVDAVQNNSLLHPTSGQTNICQTNYILHQTTFTTVLFCLTPMS